MMTHDEKVAQYVRYAKQHGVSPLSAAPPVFRLLWRRGVNVPPPAFLGFGTLTLCMGLPWGLLWGLCMWAALWRTEGVPRFLVVGGPALGGLLFGLCMGVVTRWQARKLHLPSWKDYPAALASGDFQPSAALTASLVRRDWPGEWDH